MKVQQTLRVAIFGEKQSNKETIVSYIETKQEELRKLMNDNPKMKINPGLNIEFLCIDEEYPLNTNLFSKIDFAIFVINSQIIQLSHMIKWRWEIRKLIPSKLRWMVIDYPCLNYVSNPKEFINIIEILLPNDIYFLLNYTNKQFFTDSLNDLMRFLKFEIKHIE